MAGDERTESLKRWGILGGSFDPVHEGHVHLAGAARKELGLARVLFVPAFSPPHKLSRSLAPARDRLEMLRIVSRLHDWIEIDEREIRRRGISYTFETLAELAAENPGTSFYFLIGSDTLQELATWRRIDLVAGIVTFAVLGRGPGPAPSPDLEKALSPDLEKALDGVPLKRVLLETPPLSVSSTEIRRLAREGMSAAGLLPPGVAEYIERRGLYRG